MSPTLAVTFDLLDERLDGPFDRDRFASLCQFVLGREKQSGHWEITLALVSDHELRRLHDRFMADDTVTDVMTFPMDEPGRSGGDIVISVDRAAEQAAEYGHTVGEEIDFLFVHGLLHLCGWDDRDVDSREAMVQRQMTLLDSFTRSSRQCRDPVSPER